MSFEAVNTVAQKTTAPAVDATVLPVQQDFVQLKKPVKELQSKGIYVQPKLTVGAPDDPYEKEADAVADKVMRMSEQNFVQRKSAVDEKEERLQRKPNEEDDKKVQLKKNTSESFIQKKCTDCEKEEKEKIHRKPILETITPFIQTKSNGDSAVTDSLSSSIENSQGGGSALGSSTQSFMEKRIGADFSDVKIHTGSESVQMNKELNAQAFTVGNDVYFNEGKYQPHTEDGKKLLAHELTHVVQQRPSIQNKIIQCKLAIENKTPVTNTRTVLGQNDLILEKDANQGLSIRRSKSHANPKNDAPDDINGKKGNEIITGAVKSSGKNLLQFKGINDEKKEKFKINETQLSNFIIHRKALPDEEKKYEVEGLNYKKAIVANNSGWDYQYKFFNIFSKIGILPGSQPNAYANHVYEIQRFFINNHPKEWASHKADGVLDNKTLSYLLVWAESYSQKSQSTDKFEGLDINVLRRLSSIKPTKNPPLRSSYLKDVYQFNLVNNFGFAIEYGSKGDYVMLLQKALIFLHYNISEVELGVKFGAETKSALQHFQREAGIDEKKVDGRFGQQTLRLLDDLLADKGSILVLPGIYSFVQGNINDGLQMYIDGDGDQRKELLLKFSKKKSAILLSVTHIDTKQSAGPFSFSLDGIDLAKEIYISQQLSTEGMRASEIAIINTSLSDSAGTNNPKKIIQILPPQKLKETGDYIVTSGSQTYTASFDTAKMVFESVISSEGITEPNTVAAEIKLGYFKDKFRFTIVKDNTIEDNEGDDDGNGSAYHFLLKIAGIGDNGDMVYADDVPFVLEKEWRVYQLVFSSIYQDERSIVYDFDGDTYADLKVNTVLTQLSDDRQENLKIPETGRHITVVLTGPAITERIERDFFIINGKFQFEEIKTQSVFEGNIAAEGGRLLKEQEVPENVNKEVEGIDAGLEQFYQKAVSDGSVRKETYLAYRLFKEGFKTLSPVTHKSEDQLTEDDKKQINSLATYADVFYEFFKEDTKDARKVSVEYETESSTGEKETNPFTQESVSTLKQRRGDPLVTSEELHLGEELRNHQWSWAKSTFATLKKGYNLWVSEQVKEKYKDKENDSLKITGFFQYLTGLEAIANDPNRKYVTRVKAIYYSWDQFTKEPGIKHIELPIYYYLDTAEDEWWIVDFVRPDHPFWRKADVDDTNKHIVRNDGKTPAPPAELFQKLDNKEHLPKGVLLYDAGEGIEGRIEMTEPWEWKNILGWIGLGLAAIGLAALVVLSDGTATPVAAEIFFALSAVAGGTAAALDLWGMHKDEGWDVKKAIMDVGQIVASILTLGTIGAGRLIVLARDAAVTERFTGVWAQLAKLSDMRYVTMLKMTIGTDMINLGLFTEDTIEKLNEIDNQPGLDDAARTRAKIFLLAQLFFAGGMTFLSLRGNLGGLERNPTLILHPGPDGVPMVSDARLWLPENLHTPDVLEKISAIAQQRKFPLTPNENNLSNLESLLKGVKTEAFGKSKNAVTALESLLSNSGDFENTARAVAYCEKNGFTHFDVVYEGILNIPDDKVTAVKADLTVHLAENPGFTLKFTDDEIKAIIQKGKTLKLSDEEINDFILISSREKKPITATDLMTQMDNWKIIEQRGFPFLFSDMKTFSDFKLEVKKLLIKYSVPANDIKVQGSSLRTSNAKDIDLAVFVSDAEFDAMALKLREGIVSRTASNLKLQKNLLQQLDNGIGQGRINSFLFDRLPHSPSFNQELHELNKFLTETGKVFDLSVMKTSGKFVLSPSLNF
ncbi:MAG: DUF4157 domain-containing protein [Panacibacter sp.]